MERCMVHAMSAAMDTPVVHDFSMFTTLVYPRKAYDDLRDYIDSIFNEDLEDFLRKGRKACLGDYGNVGEIPPLMYETGLMGSFLW